MPCVIWGKPGSPIENIELKNVQITTKGGHPALEASLDPEENDERFPRHVGAIPAYACYLRHVRNVRFLNCCFGFEKNDDRPALVVDGIAESNTRNAIGTLLEVALFESDIFPVADKTAAADAGFSMRIRGLVN